MTEMISLPRWARKPKHRLTVVATNRGWVVQETGELLVSHRNLKDRLELLKPTPQKKEEPKKEIKVETAVYVETEPVKETKVKDKVENVDEPKPKRKYTKRKKKEEIKTEE